MSLFDRVGRRDELGQRLSHLVRMEAERSGFALVGNSARPVDDVETVRPAGVGAFGTVLHVVDKRRNVNPEFDHAGVRSFVAVFQRVGAGNEHVVLDVVWHLPAVGGMRLLDVDHIESHLFFVLLVQLVERGHLPAEGRSRVTAEDQRHRLPPAER